MALERFRKIVSIREGDMAKAFVEDTRDYGVRRYARTRVNVDGDGFVLGLGDFQPGDSDYRRGEDAYLLAIQKMEEMCRHWQDPSKSRMSRDGNHIIQHLFGYNIFALAEKESGFVSPIVIHGTAYYTRERIVIYRRFLFGVVKYFVDRNVVRFVPDKVFDRFLAVFGDYRNWIPGRMGHAIFNFHAEHAPFYGYTLANLSGLLRCIKKEMQEVSEGEYTVCCCDPCSIAGEVNRYLFNFER